MDMYPGGDALPKNFFIFHDLLYFSAADAARGRELWVYDGVNMPMPVTDINPGAGPSHPSYLVVYKDELYFVATNPTTSGFEWYVMRDTTSPAAPTAVALTAEHLKCVASPNPVQDVLHISWELARPATFSVRLADASGRTVWSKASKNVSAGSGKTVIPMGQVPPGLYFYQLVGADGKMLANGRVVKQ